MCLFNVLNAFEGNTILLDKRRFPNLFVCFNMFLISKICLRYLFACQCYQEGIMMFVLSNSLCSFPFCFLLKTRGRLTSPSPANPRLSSGWRPSGERRAQLCPGGVFRRDWSKLLESCSVFVVHHDCC